MFNNLHIQWFNLALNLKETDTCLGEKYKKETWNRGGGGVND